MHNGNILIIGASSALGVEFIRSYGHEYAHIIAHCNSNERELTEFIAHGHLSIIRCDLSSEEGVNRLLKHDEVSKRQLDSVIFIAAPRLQIVRFHKLSWDHILLQINVQARAAFMIVKSILPGMAERKSGKIVFILSSVLDGKPPQGMSDYVVGKHTVLGLMKAIAAEYAGKGICVNAVSPSMMATKFVEKLPPLLVEMSADAHPRGANAKPSEIVPVIRFLLSKDASFITGQNIIASGGG
jgi:3-oxoacyl-[acyl-carrier protein] reductase